VPHLYQADSDDVIVDGQPPATATPTIVLPPSVTATPFPPTATVQPPGPVTTLELAEHELLTAQQMGMPAAEIQQLLDQGISNGARLQRWLRKGGYSLVAWLLFPIVLLVIGGVLSRLTLASAYKIQPVAVFQLSRGERLLRCIYWLVISAASLYYYISIPFLILIVLAAGAGIFYLFLEAGTIPVRLALFIGLAILYTLYAIVRSIFTRLQDSEPGRPLSQDEAPGLWVITQKVA
jgi:hypothetical protein